MKILISAYSCEPSKGSESEVGWGMALEVARRHDVWVLTRDSNRKTIENDPGSASSGIRWVYFDLNKFWLRAKKYPLGIYPYYYFWQRAVRRVAEKLHADVGFDIVQHGTFCNYWMPTRLCSLGVPFVWGPLGGGETLPVRLFPEVGWRGCFDESLRALARIIGENMPATKSCALQASVALAANEETAARLRKLGCDKIKILSQVAVDSNHNNVGVEVAREGPLRLISAGRLVYWKGISLAARALGLASRKGVLFNWRIVGTGPDYGRLKRIIEAEGIQDSVEFIGFVPRTRLQEMFRESELLVHPSLHESGGFVCAEAMSNGLPVMCFNYGGPRVVVPPQAGFLIDLGSPQSCREEMAQIFMRLWKQRAVLDGYAKYCRQYARTELSREKHWGRLEEIYAQLANGPNRADA